ncbi:hypothetical protein VOLCADRAFT_90922 [Volvox carteri f. nagariensis]|uniref:Uncharacterized protein n=1 Tax=Volvox carteri f. nagariensis TaxID=3068 RepID=D8TVQ8_VOLCA|nr:uncharacterized protein VOLCADRAFT_90922 [Volvox carteri f. nagariensis]EFJ48345.1 hypothetical protein VOLCADRAFT_90922 [Volvox carteri f. nagariensis]|eukprot:XP_002950599.1 hypothetical protein VOLCADRAFT_90922 [Volvox carteri f. nagariensis]
MACRTSLSHLPTVHAQLSHPSMAAAVEPAHVHVPQARCVYIPANQTNISHPLKRRDPPPPPRHGSDPSPGSSSVLQHQAKNTQGDAKGAEPFLHGHPRDTQGTPKRQGSDTKRTWKRHQRDMEGTPNWVSLASDTKGTSKERPRGTQGAPKGHGRDNQGHPRAPKGRPRDTQGTWKRNPRDMEETPKGHQRDTQGQ